MFQGLGRICFDFTGWTYIVHTTKTKFTVLDLQGGPGVVIYSCHMNKQTQALPQDVENLPYNLQVQVKLGFGGSTDGIQH